MGGTVLSFCTKLFASSFVRVWKLAFVCVIIERTKFDYNDDIRLRNKNFKMLVIRVIIGLIESYFWALHGNGIVWG